MAPLAANFRAVSFPIPPEDPVIIATFPFKFMLYYRCGPALVLEYTIPITTINMIIDKKIGKNMFIKINAFQSFSIAKIWKPALF